MIKTRSLSRLAIPIIAVCGFWGLAVAVSSVAAEILPIRLNQHGQLFYQHDDRGNRIPDFSHCGFHGGKRGIPNVPIKVTVEPIDGDDGRRIQSAIDYVSKLPLSSHGFRGAVLLKPGCFEVSGQLHIHTSGVVLRGSGATEAGTTLSATGVHRRSLIRISGKEGLNLADEFRRVINDYVPVGANSLTLDSSNDLQVGDTVIVTRPSTSEWIEALGANAIGVAWKPGTRDIRWDRVITAIDNNSIVLDAPLTTAIEKPFGGATVRRYVWPDRIENVGVEDLDVLSCYRVENPTTKIMLGLASRCKMSEMRGFGELI